MARSGIIILLVHQIIHHSIAFFMVLSKVITKPTDFEHPRSEVKSKSCSLFFGRAINRLATTCMSVAKVLITTTATLGLMSLPRLGLGASVALSPQALLERTTFRPYILRFMRPGWQQTREHTMSVDTERRLETKEQCHELALKYLQTNPPNYSLPVQPLGYSSGNTLIEGLVRNINYFVDHRYGKRYERAVDYVEKTFLQEASPFEQSEAEIIEYLKNVHRLLTEDPANSLEGIDSEISKYLKSLRVEEQAGNILPGRFRELSFASNEERATWKKEGFHIPIEPLNIALYMQAFANFLRGSIAFNIDPVDLAAVVHIRLVAIHPFTTANGRLARLLLNAILVRYAGIPPVIFPSQKPYINAVRQAIVWDNAAHFAEYLRGVILWNRVKGAILRYMPIDSARAFPLDNALMMHPGVMLTKDGMAACSLGEKSDEPNWCDERVSKALKDRHTNLIISNLDSFEPQMAGGVFHEDMYFSMNPQVLKNYKEAQAQAEDLILKNPLAFIESVNATIEIFDAIHIALSSNLPDSQQQTPGFYRTSRRILQPPYIIDSAKSVLSESDFRLFMSTFEDFKKASRNLTEHEVVIWKKAGAYFPPYPEKVDEEMQRFAVKLQLLIEKGEDFIYIASFAHTEIVRISPYHRNNGKLARLVMNSILLRYLGINPIVIPDKVRYLTIAAKAVRGEPEAFFKYLKELIPESTFTYTKCDD